MNWDLPSEERRDSVVLAAKVVVLRRYNIPSESTPPRLRGRTTYEVVPFRWYNPRHVVAKLAAWRFERRFGRA